MTDRDFYDVLNEGLSADKMRGVECDGWSVTEFLPGVYEIVAAGREMPQPIGDFLKRRGLKWANQVLMSEWHDLDDGRMCCTVMKA